VRRRLIWAIAGTSAVAVLLLAVPLGIVLGRNYRDEDLLRLQRDTIAATRQVDLGGQARDPVELPPSRDVLGAYDRAGRRIAGRGPAAAPPVVLRAVSSGRPADATGGGHFVVAVPLLRAERVIGAVLAQRDDSGARADTTAAWLVIGAVAAPGHVGAPPRRRGLLGAVGAVGPARGRRRRRRAGRHGRPARRAREP
jgi:hypothetical protein